MRLLRSLFTGRDSAPVRNYERLGDEHDCVKRCEKNILLERRTHQVHCTMKNNKRCSRPGGSSVLFGNFFHWSRITLRYVTLSIIARALHSPYFVAYHTFFYNPFKFL